MTGKSFTIAKGSILFITTSSIAQITTGGVIKIGSGSRFSLDNSDGTVYSIVVAFVANSDGSITYRT